MTCLPISALKSMRCITAGGVALGGAAQSSEPLQKRYQVDCEPTRLDRLASSRGLALVGGDYGAVGGTGASMSLALTYEVTQ